MAFQKNCLGGLWFVKFQLKFLELQYTSEGWKNTTELGKNGITNLI